MLWGFPSPAVHGPYCTARERERMMSNEIKMGQIYADVQPPRRRWRVVADRDGRYMLQRADKPSVSRFPDAKTLLDRTLYEKVEGPGG